MSVFALLVYVTGAYPLVSGWRCLRQTSLSHAYAWTCVAWLVWAAVLALAPNAVSPVVSAGRYLGLCLIGCAGVAVLGARRPGVGAWNFVLLGLLAVMLLPLAQGLLLGGQALDTVRLAAGALLLALGCGWEATALFGRATGLSARLLEPGWLCVALAPWAGLLGW